MYDLERRDVVSSKLRRSKKHPTQAPKVVPLVPQTADCGHTQFHQYVVECALCRSTQDSIHAARRQSQADRSALRRAIGEPGHLRRLTVEWGARRIRKPVARDARFQHPRCEIRELQALGLRSWPPHRARREAVQLQNGRRRPRVHVLTRFHRRRLVHRLMLRYGSLRLCLRIEQRHHQPRSVRILTQLRARLAPPRSGAVESRRACSWSCVSPVRT